MVMTAISQAAPPNPKHWRDLLTKPVDDEWQQIFGNSLFQHKARPAESLADKLKAIQALIAKSNKSGLTVPVFVPPALTLKRFAAIPTAPRGIARDRTGVPLKNVPAFELFRYVGSLSNCDVIETERGIIFKPLKHP
jgi:hypothetical protein